MKHSMNFVSVVAVSILGVAANANAQIESVRQVVAVPSPRPLPKVPACVDPAITNLVVTNVSRQASGAYNFSLSVTLRNAGTADYVTNPAQQKVRVYEDPQGSIGPRLIRSQDFGNLRVGETREIRVNVLGWWISQEFPWDYQIAIEYDPDIAIDGNRANDDCRLVNNRRTIGADAINAQLRASGR